MSDLILKSTKNGVTTLTLNNPRRLNGWTMPMLLALLDHLAQANTDDGTQALVLTGTDPYYSAGVNLSSTVSPMHPRKLHEMIRTQNQALFDAFLDLDKPMLIAVNGPAIGACVTSATLVDGLIASEKATFSLPFARLGVPPEGCSSVHLPRLIGEDNTQRILGKEGWVPTAEEALSIGLVNKVVAHDQLMDEAQAMAEAWVQEGKQRTFRAGSSREELKAVNAEESKKLADAFLGRPFLKGQAKFLWRKKKRSLAIVFGSLWATQPLWSKLI